MVLENKVNTKPIDYAELNRLSEDFVKRFVLRRELFDEQALHPILNQSSSSPIKIEAPRELPKMEAAVQQYHVDKQCNDRLLYPIISQDIVNIVVNSSVDVNTSVKVNSYVIMNDSVNYVEIRSKRFSELEQHCISLEIAMQLNKEIFQKTYTSVNQTEPSFDQLFELNNLKVELQAKDTTIKKLKAHIKHINETSTSESVNKDFNEIETINIELEYRVTRLIAENEHLKQTYKQHYDSIKPSRVRAKEQTESLVNQVNQKFVEISDLNAQLQEKVKENNRENHEYYLKHTMEQAAILREVVEQAKSQNPLDSASYSACMYVKLIQELLGYVRDTCPDIHKPSEKLVAVTPINKKKTVRFADTVTSSGNIPKVPNRPLLSSTGVNPSTSASGSKPSGNTKNDRIQQTPSSNEKNKVEVQSSMNVHAKSVSKKNKKRKEWKPIGKVFNSTGYKWKPTGKTFTLVGNACPLTRLTATKKVPLRVPIPLEVVAPKQVVTRVYTRRPKVPKSVQNSKPKVAKTITANRMEPSTSRGSDTLVAPSSSSLIDYRFSKLFCGI
ncbi:hypothetical protein Tco_0468769 [Tanacetum coccineum]